MLEGNPGLDLAEFHTDLVPSFSRVRPSPDAVGHRGVVLWAQLHVAAASNQPVSNAT
jgi:hypothetical protein